MYTVYSKYYDQLETTSQEVVEFISDRIQKYFPEAKSLLEIGCGTGNNMISLKEKFEVSGLDISKEMLTLAKKKLPTLKFFIGDMSSFKISEKFDVIISIYDSINHLDELSKWKTCFKSVYEHLNTKGLFVFDVNTLHKLTTMSESPVFGVNVENQFLQMKVDKLTDNKFNWGIKTFNKEDLNSVLEEENIVECAFESIEIENMLRDCQFKILEKVELDGNPSTPTSNRIYFVCIKE